MADDEVTLATAARLRGLKKRTLQAAAARGTLRARQLDRFWVTTMGYVDAWLRDAKHRPGPLPGMAPRPRATKAGT